jgi:hypothetical protein
MNLALAFKKPSNGADVENKRSFAEVSNERSSSIPKQ